EQSVADKGQVVGRKEIANVTGGVSRRLEHATSQRADLDLITFSHGHVHQWNARGLSVRGNNPTIVTLLELGNTPRVIRVMMGDENIAEQPSGCFQCGLDWCGFRRINCCRHRSSDRAAARHNCPSGTETDGFVRAYRSPDCIDAIGVIRHPALYTCKSRENMFRPPEARGTCYAVTMSIDVVDLRNFYAHSPSAFP